MNRNKTVESVAQKLKDLDALEARVTAQDLQLVHLQRKKKSLEADLWKAQEQRKLATKKLADAQDLLERIARSHKGGNTQLSPHFAREVHRVVEDMKLKRHQEADAVTDNDYHPF